MNDARPVSSAAARQQRVRRRRAPAARTGARRGGRPGKQRDRNRERQIDDARGAQCARQADPCDQDETARQRRPQPRPGCWKNRASRSLRRAPAWCAPAPALISGKVAPSRTDCGRISAQRPERRLARRRRGAPGRAEGRQQHGVGPSRGGDEDLVKRERAQADHRFDRRVSRGADCECAWKSARTAGRTERHAAHEHDQHQRLRVGRMPEVELQVMGPDRFVDQPEKPLRVKTAARTAREPWMRMG